MNLETILPKNLFEDLKLGLIKEKQLTISGLANKSAKSYLIASIFNNKTFTDPRRIVWVLSTENDVVDLYFTLQVFLEAENWEINKLTGSKDPDQERTEWAIKFLSKPKINQIYILTESEASSVFPSPEKLRRNQLEFIKGAKINLLSAFNQLIENGYEVCGDVMIKKGQYRRSGSVLDIFPLGFDNPVKIEIDYDEIASIYEFLFEKKEVIRDLKQLSVYPQLENPGNKLIFDYLGAEDVLIFDDLESQIATKNSNTDCYQMDFTSFPEQEDTRNIHLRFLSLLKFFTIFDLISDLKEKINSNWQIIILSKRIVELKNIFTEENIRFSESEMVDYGVHLVDAKELKHIPASFQEQQKKILFLTDREIFQLRKGRKIKALENANLEFLTSLKPGDFVVHADNGIGRFIGIEEKEISGTTREFLEIAYAENDKLFVPVDQADKITRYITEEGSEPKLTRLGSADWRQIQKRVKKETEKIAKELLKIQALRAKSKGHSFDEDTSRQREFEKTFPYEETPGQMKAILDAKKDMEGGLPMDRLVCGDVGFGKTEVAMRAAFKAVESGKQVALISPVTILADQHYKSFRKRMDQFGVKIEMLSRFRTPKEQREVLDSLKKGKVDIIIGTHRLLQEDVEFYDLGLLVIDEEQRFGVKQKERLKKMRSQVDILTLSATPIPRTLNLALHKLRDITTITTPPPGRLPIITEIRKYSEGLVREAILKELKRGGQVFFLHNRVETIEAIAEKMRLLIPEAKFIVAHGQMKAELLESRIVSFKNKEHDVLISSTIIENGIDLPNANTLIVNNAEKFGLAQLYQLRGRIGRGKVQAYAYFLYHTQKLKPEAKKRLRAIVEASELGSGFQIAMKDLEIRGAGDVLGVNQHGTVNAVGVHHFLRLLNKTIEEIKVGHDKNNSKEKDVSIEVPLDAYIPSTFIADQKEKILAYQQLASIKTFEGLEEVATDLEQEFGELPIEVKNLFKILNLKLHAKKAGVLAVRSIQVGKAGREIELHLSEKVTAVEIMNLLKHNDSWLISGDKLKINVKKLGFNWLEELVSCLEKLKKGENAREQLQKASSDNQATKTSTSKA
jgi:transcription-repair coupling factor (superfamily II helicase)